MAFTTTASGLRFEDIVVGSGAEAKPGRNVTKKGSGSFLFYSRNEPDPFLRSLVVAVRGFALNDRSKTLGIPLASLLRSSEVGQSIIYK